jgi:hypothetical protein
VLIPEGDILLVCEFGLSKAFDIDNAVKPFQEKVCIIISERHKKGDKKMKRCSYALDNKREYMI